ncbi:ComEC/Rec2 family competence protein [Christiangramia sp. LLG6405-1]|uniref:ComEC/Rec2 family competence protein n=1 Tax=Christiangramia sp. LLG6405-1 TaxID=3160832 RepID=UPI003865AD51
MKSSEFVFIRLSLYLLAGILVGFSFTADLRLSLVITTSCLLLFFIAYYRSSKLIFPDVFFGIVTFLLVASLGFTAVQLRQPENINSHYTNFEIEAGQILKAEVSEELKPNQYNSRYIVEARSLQNKEKSEQLSGKILLSIKKNIGEPKSLKPGDILLLPFTTELVKAPANPFMFSYRDYLEGLKIHRQLQITPTQVEVLSFNKSLHSYSRSLRTNLIDNVRKYNFSQDELAVFQALILGQRSDLNDKLYKDYASAGAVHILAISGLHIGILLLMLNWLLKPLKRFKAGKWLSLLLCIVLLWSFAVLTGLQPSVVRAVTMFSFLAIGLNLKRKTGAFNSLSLSFFFLLLIDPYYILQVGFQLSYLAVFSILLIQPKLYGLISIDHKFLDYFWKLSSVSIAAQIGVLPLSIYYFHQFPGLFLLTNLFILPFLGVLLFSGILVLILAYVGWLPDLLVWLFNKLLSIMNWVVTEIASIKPFVFSNINLSIFQTIAFYLILAGMMMLWQKLNYRNLIAFAIGLIILQLSFIANKFSNPSAEIVVMHRYKESMITFKDNKNVIVATSTSEAAEPIDYIRERKIEELEKTSLEDFYMTPEGLLYIQSDSINLPELEIHPDILLLRNSPKVNFDRLLINAQPKQIIADGSNYPYLIKKWKATASNKKIPFHATAEKGAYMMR